MNILNHFPHICRLINKFKSSKPKIALTFDDGHKYASQINKKLNKYGVKATFFLCGCYIEKNLDIYREIYKAGHEIGNHSYNHPHMTDLSESDILTELSRTQELIKKIASTANRSKLFRFPYGTHDEALTHFIEEQGYTPVAWTIDSDDWTGISASEICNNILSSNYLTDRTIILMHTSGEHTAEALDLIIPALKKQRYKIVHVSDLLSG